MFGLRIFAAPISGALFVNVPVELTVGCVGKQDVTKLFYGSNIVLAKDLHTFKSLGLIIRLNSTILYGISQVIIGGYHLLNRTFL